MTVAAQSSRFECETLIRRCFHLRIRLSPVGVLCKKKLSSANLHIQHRTTYFPFMHVTERNGRHGLFASDVCVYLWRFIIIISYSPNNYFVRRCVFLLFLSSFNIVIVKAIIPLFIPDGRPA